MSQAEGYRAGLEGRAAARSPGTAAVIARHPPMLPTAIPCLLILSEQLLPPMPQYFGVSDSLAMGTTFAVGICIVTVAIYWAIRARLSHHGPGDIPATAIVSIATILILVVLHGVVADQTLGIDVARFLASLIALTLLLAGGFALSVVLRDARPEQLDTVARASFWVLCMVIIFSLAGVEPPGIPMNRATFPFTETSHFALAFGPIFLYQCATSRPQHRTMWILFGLAFAIVIKSATFVAITCIAALIGRRFLLICALGVLTLSVASASHLNLKYFVSRANLSSTSSNLSALVYLEGWEMLDRSLVLSHGWGLGFEQLGLHGTDVTAAAAIRGQTNGRDLNLQNGSFVLSKLGAEFGVTGLLLAAVYCALAFKCVRSLRSGRSPPQTIFPRSVVLAYGIDMFIRGSGYFTPSTLLFIGALIALAPISPITRVTREIPSAMQN